jgi:hypothetical protein
MRDNRGCVFPVPPLRLRYSFDRPIIGGGYANTTKNMDSHVKLLFSMEAKLITTIISFSDIFGIDRPVRFTLNSTYRPSLQFPQLAAVTPGG